MNPPVLDSGIASALRWLVRECKDRFGLTVETNVEEVDLTDASIRKFFFRAVRELLFNVVKHAEYLALHPALPDAAGPCTIGAVHRPSRPHLPSWKFDPLFSFSGALRNAVLRAGVGATLNST